MVGHTALDACATAKVRERFWNVLQAVQEFGPLARTVFAYGRSCRPVRPRRRGRPRSRTGDH